MRLGFFGGSFDPPHRGHLAVAQAALRRFALDRVLLAPAALQPLKRKRAEASFCDRMQMVELLCGESEELGASSVDGPQPNGEPNYTVDTLKRLRATLTADTEVFVIVGADSFLTVRQWRSSEELLRTAEWIVVSRPGFDLGSLELTEAERARVHVLDDVAEPVSATGIRRRLAAGEDCSGLLPEAVIGYIRERGLYARAVS